VFAGLVFTGNDYLRNETTRFFDSDCSIKEKIMDAHGLKYVYSKTRIKCENLGEIYSDDRYIYVRD
jgi:hypothetical protein